MTLDGVIVRLRDGAMVKIKTDWWFKAGYCSRFRAEAAEWKVAEARRLQQSQSRMQNDTDIEELFSAALNGDFP